MAREGKHDKFSRKLCELLIAQLGDSYQYTGAPEHGLVRSTSFGADGICILLSGANAPYKHLDFIVGARHDVFEKTWLKLELPPLLGSFRFWNTTGNAVYAWPELKRFTGNWSINLDDEPTKILSEVVSSLPHCLKAVNECLSDLEHVRDLVLKRDRCIFNQMGWPEIVVMDAVLAKWEHLATFLQSEESRTAWDRDEGLLQKVRKELGWKPS